jgi:leucyl-tRNA synthetase
MVEKRYDQNIKDAVQVSDDATKELERERNNAIKKIAQAFDEGYKFNSAISYMMILANAIDKYKTNNALSNQAIETLVLLLTPFTPHVAEEMWQMMGKKETTVSRVNWPALDESALVLSNINYAVQVNGKVRGQILMPVGSSQESIQAAAIAEPNVIKYLENQTIKKIIVVPNKIVSIVI